MGSATARNIVYYSTYYSLENAGPSPAQGCQLYTLSEYQAKHGIPMYFAGRCHV